MGMKRRKSYVRRIVDVAKVDWATWYLTLECRHIRHEASLAATHATWKDKCVICRRCREVDDTITRLKGELSRLEGELSRLEKERFVANGSKTTT